MQVIQRREDGSVSFSGTWDNYKRGFGFAGGEFWLGNDNLHHITNQKSYELRVEIELWNESRIIREFNHFRVGDETSKYQLVISSQVSEGVYHIANKYTVHKEYQEHIAWKTKQKSLTLTI